MAENKKSIGKGILTFITILIISVGFKYIREIPINNKNNEQMKLTYESDNLWASIQLSQYKKYDHDLKEAEENLKYAKAKNKDNIHSYEFKLRSLKRTDKAYLIDRAKTYADSARSYEEEKNIKPTEEVRKKREEIYKEYAKIYKDKKE